MEGRYDTSKIIIEKWMCVVFAFSLIYKLLLEIVYVEYFSVEYAYSGFTYQSPSFDIIVISWLLTCVFLFWIIKLLKRICISGIVIVCIFYFHFVPSMVMFMYKPAEHMWIYVLYWIVLAIAYSVIKEISIKATVNSGNTIIKILAYVFVFLTLFIWAYYARFHIQLSITDVYDQRIEASAYSMPTLISYIYMNARSLLPALALWSYHNKKKTESILFVLASLISFCIDGSKSTVFTLLGAFLVYWILNNKVNRIRLIPVGMTAVVFLARCEHIFLGTANILWIFVRRIIFLPTVLDYFYYDFFSNNEFDYFRQSIMKYFGFQSPYKTRIPLIIGKEYFYSTSNSANNGLFSDAYANLGIIGIIVLPILIVLMLKLFDSCAKGLRIELLIVPIILLSLNIISSSFFTNLINHGVVAMLLVTWIMPKNNSTKINLESR